MQTNKNISPESDLHLKGKNLLQAAHDYWKAYQKECGSSAVVWLEADDGHFILFTRSEYKVGIIGRALLETSEEPHLFSPFGAK